MKPQFFIDLLNILKEYNNKDFDKSDMEKIFSTWVKNGVISLDDLMHLTDKPFYEFYSDVCAVPRNITVKTDNKYEVAEVEVDYIDRFKKSDSMQKKTLALLCERSTMWVHLNKENFKNDRNGVNLISFLSWLKGHDYRSYLIFQKNYK